MSNERRRALFLNQTVFVEYWAGQGTFSRNRARGVAVSGGYAMVPIVTIPTSGATVPMQWRQVRRASVFVRDLVVCTDASPT